MTPRSRNPYRHEPDNLPVHVGSEYSRGSEQGDMDLSVAAQVNLKILQATDRAQACAEALCGLLALNTPVITLAAYLELAAGGGELRGVAARYAPKAARDNPSKQGRGAGGVGTAATCTERGPATQLETALQALCIPLAEKSCPLTRALLERTPRQVPIAAVQELHAILSESTGAGDELILLPALGQTEPVGLLVLQVPPDAARAGADEMRAGSLISNTLGMVLERLRTDAALARRVDAYLNIQQGAMEIGQATSLPDVFLTLAKAATLCVRAERSVVWSYRESSQRLDLAAQYVAAPCDALDALLPRLKDLAERCASHNAALLYPDLRTDEEMNAGALPQPLPASVVPLCVFGETVGVLAAIGRQAADDCETVFTPHEEELLRFMGSAGAVAVKNARQGERIKAEENRLKEMQKMLIAAEKLAAIGELSGQLAEEIRGPIGSIASFARRLEKSLPVDETTREDARILAHEAERIEEILIEQVRLVQEGKNQQTMQQINRIVHDCVGLLRDDMTGRGVFLEETYADRVPELLLDESRIKHMVVNILRSSLDVLRDGDTIRLETLREGDRVLLEIAHTGDSMPGEIIESLFVPFSTDRPSGAGLGLAVAQQAVKEHGGEISVRSEGEWGAIFTISIPIRTNRDRRRTVKRRSGRDRRDGRAA